MRQLFIIYILSILFISCQKKTQEPEFANKRYKDTFFKIKKLKFDWSKDISDIYEVYISNQNDTLLNQSKRFDKLVVDSTVSDFYDLKWYKTKIKNTYDASIRISSPADLKFKNYKGYETITKIGFLEHTKDSQYSTIKEFKNTDEINFKYSNIESDQLEGIITKRIYIDTLVNGEDSVRIIYKKYILNNTNNSNELSHLIEAFDFYKDNKFSMNLLKNQ